MNCRELAELLCDFIDGDLTPEQRQHIEDHLCRCPPCVIYVETYRLTITMSRPSLFLTTPRFLIEMVPS